MCISSGLICYLLVFNVQFNLELGAVRHIINTNELL